MQKHPHVRKPFVWAAALALFLGGFNAALWWTCYQFFGFDSLPYAVHQMFGVWW